MPLHRYPSPITARALLLAVLALGSASLATAAAEVDPSKMDKSQAAPAAPLTDGEIKKIEQSTGKVTIKHGDIPHLDMPGMTMVFTAKDKKLLTGFMPGDKIRFTVVSENGKLVITHLEPAR